jgi:hypothetical protein
MSDHAGPQSHSPSVLGLENEPPPPHFRFFAEDDVPASAAMSNKPKRQRAPNISAADLERIWSLHTQQARPKEIATLVGASRVAVRGAISRLCRERWADEAPETKRPRGRPRINLQPAHEQLIWAIVHHVPDVTLRELQLALKIGWNVRVAGTCGVCFPCVSTTIGVCNRNHSRSAHTCSMWTDVCACLVITDRLVVPTCCALQYHRKQPKLSLM